MASLGWLVAAVLAALAFLGRLFVKKGPSEAVQAVRQQQQAAVAAAEQAQHAKLVEAEKAVIEKVQNAGNTDPNRSLADYLGSR